MFIVKLFKHMVAFVCLGTDPLQIMDPQVQSILSAKVKKSFFTKRLIPQEFY